MGGPPRPPVPPGRRADGYLSSLLLWGPVQSLDPGVLWSLLIGASHGCLRGFQGPRQTQLRQGAHTKCPVEAVPPEP